MTTDTLLHDRSASGFRVELHRQGSVFWVTGETDQHSGTAVIAPEQALEAFHHPCTFLPSPELFFARRPQESEEGEENENEQNEQNEQSGHSQAVAGTPYCELCENFLAGNEFRVCTSCRENGS